MPKEVKNKKKTEAITGKKGKKEKGVKGKLRRGNKAKKDSEEELLDVSRGWKKQRASLVKVDQRLVKRDADYSQKDEQDKRLMMWAGVAFFMILILFFWILNIRKSFNNGNQIDSRGGIDWGEMKENFDETMEQMKEGIKEFKAATEEEVDTGDDIKKEQLNENEMDELKQRLKEIEKKLEIE